jgi:flavin reductase (DIM6/NTAB) family NADH-FMN oxidoreductase RutF
VECEVVETVEKGDHDIVVGKVVDAGAAQQPEGRPDDVVLWLKELGPRVFYGG